MPICYADTVVIHTEVKSDPRITTNNQWKPYIPKKNSNSPPPDSYAVIPVNRGTSKIFLSYYKNLYGRSLLYINFNIRKLYGGTALNSEPIMNLDLNVLESKLMGEISPYVDLSKLKAGVLDFQASRIDLAINHLVEELLFDEYLDAISKLAYRNYLFNNYKGTHYLMSSKKRYKSSAIVIRLYDKTDEMLANGHSYTDAYVKRHYQIAIDHSVLALDDWIEENLEVVELPRLLVGSDGKIYKQLRLELCFRRSKLVREFKKTGQQPTLRNVLDESFQKKLINQYIQELKLDAPILSRKTFKQEVQSKFSDPVLIKDIMTMAANIRNSKNPLSSNLASSSVNRDRNWYYRVRSKLYDKGNGCHLITTTTVDLEPIQLL